MKQIIEIGVIVLVGCLFLTEKSWSENRTDTLYTDPRLQFEMEYPNEFLKQKSYKEMLPNGVAKTMYYPGLFESDDKKTRLNIYGKVAKGPDDWEEFMEGVLKGFSSEQDEITYKVAKKNLFVISGFSGANIFYDKYIPVEKDGQRILLTFNMIFPRDQKKVWDPILADCANSFKSKNLDQCWYYTAEELLRQEELRAAKQWIDKNLSCDQMEPSGSGDEKAVREKYLSDDEDDENVLFFNLGQPNINQFVLMPHGPSGRGAGCGFHGSPVVCDQKFVFFTFANQKITGKVIFENKDGATRYAGAIQVISFQNGEKGLLLNNLDNHCDCGLTGHLFMKVKGILKPVLTFDESYEPCTAAEESEGGGFSSILVPQDDGSLQLLKRNYQMVEGDEESAPGNYSYSEIIYKFDLELGAYKQVGPEKVLPAQSAESEWTQLNATKN